MTSRENTRSGEFEYRKWRRRAHFGLDGAAKIPEKWGAQLQHLSREAEELLNLEAEIEEITKDITRDGHWWSLIPWMRSRNKFQRMSCSVR